MMTAEEKEFVDAMLDKLPPVIARHQVDRFLGGLVSPSRSRTPIWRERDRKWLGA